MAVRDSTTGVAGNAIRHRIGGRAGITSVNAFSAQLLSFSHHVKEEVDDVSQHIALFSWKMLTRLTPVLSGRARQSWNFSFDTPDYYVPPKGTYTFPIHPKLRKAEAEFRSVFVTTGLVYMQRLEDGYSEKGEKMTEKTLHAVDFSIPSIIGGRNV